MAEVALLKFFKIRSLPFSPIFELRNTLVTFLGRNLFLSPSCLPL